MSYGTIAADFGTILVNGIPLVLVVAGLVSFAKTMGLEGKGLLALSLVLGLLFGVGYQMSIAMPRTLAEWFGTVVFGLGLGVTTSGLYDLVKRDVVGRQL